MNPEPNLKAVSLLLNGENWVEYQKMCLDLRESPSYRIRKFIEEDLKKNKKKPS